MILTTFGFGDNNKITYKSPWLNGVPWLKVTGVEFDGCSSPIECQITDDGLRQVVYIVT